MQKKNKIWLAIILYGLSFCSLAEMNSSFRFTTEDKSWKVNRSKVNNLGPYILLHDQSSKTKNKKQISYLYASGLLYLKGRSFHEYSDDEVLVFKVNGTPVNFKRTLEVATESKDISSYYNILYMPVTKKGRLFLSRRLQAGLVVTVRDEVGNILYSVKVAGFDKLSYSQTLKIETL